MDQQEIEAYFGPVRIEAEKIAVEEGLEKALAYLDTSFQGSPHFHELAVKGFFWRAQSVIYKIQEKHAKVIEAGKKSADYYERAELPLEIAKSRVVIIYSLAHLSRFDEAKELANELVSWFDDLVIGQIFVRKNLVHVHFLEGEIEHALGELKNIRQLCLENDMPGQAVELLMEIALCFETLERYPEALDSYQLAVEEIGLAIEPVAPWLPIKVRFNNAILLIKLGRFEEALQLLGDVRQKSRLTSPSDRGFVAMAEGAVRAYLGDAELAVHFFEEALNHFEHPHDKVETQLLMSRHLRMQQGRELLKALEIANDGMGILRDEENVPYMKLMLVEQAEILLALGRKADAKDVAERALAMHTVEDRPIQQRLLQTIYAESIMIQDPRKAVALLVEIVESPHLALELTIRAKVSLGSAYFQLGDFGSAAEAFSESLSMIQNWGRSIKGHSSQAGLMEQIRDPLENLLECMVRLQKDGLQIMSVLEQVRSHALTEIGSEAYRYQAAGEVRDLFERREQLMRQLDMLMRPITHRSEESTMINQAEIGERESNRTNVLKGELVRVEEAIRREQPEPLTGEDSAELSGNDEPLPADTALLTWFRANERLFVVVMFKGQTEYHPLGFSIDQVLADWQKLFRNWLRQKRGRAARGRAARGRARDIWANLVGPVRGVIDEADKLLIVPIDQLWQIPFGGLIDAELDQRVCERWELVSAPSQSVWRMCHKRKATAEGVLLVGAAGDPNDSDYLPAVETEIDMLKGKYPQAELLRGRRVTRQNLISNLPENHLVHIAGHIEYDASRPVLSGIRLHENRYFRASDFYLRPNSLTGAHVVLSGCDSGRVSQLGTEIIGLTSSLVAAGAKSVLVSLWPIDDAATAEFMSLYYDCLQESASPSAALRTAQQRMLKSAKFNHPIFWGAFVSLFS